MRLCKITTRGQGINQALEREGMKTAGEHASSLFARSEQQKRDDLGRETF